jgi:hypothetical protein
LGAWIRTLKVPLVKEIYNAEEISKDTDIDTSTNIKRVRKARIKEYVNPETGLVEIRAEGPLYGGK